MVRVSRSGIYDSWNRLQSGRSKRPAAQLLDREFTATGSNQKWGTAITYLASATSWIYLAAVVDLFNHKVVGWAVSQSPATELVQGALKEAVKKRRPAGSQILHHSDRSCQYPSESYQQTLRTLGITCSMSRAGNCNDHAVAERFLMKPEAPVDQPPGLCGPRVGSCQRVQLYRNVLQRAPQTGDARIYLTQRVRVTVPQACCGCVWRHNGQGRCDSHLNQIRPCPFFGGYRNCPRRQESGERTS